MKPLKDIGETLELGAYESIKGRVNNSPIRKDIILMLPEERRELVRAVWEAARSVSGNTTNYYTHGDDVEKLIKESGL